VRCLIANYTPAMFGKLSRSGARIYAQLGKSDGLLTFGSCRENEASRIAELWLCMFESMPLLRIDESQSPR
jgi:hypothetical protein